jgi:hypothetical protein
MFDLRRKKLSPHVRDTSVIIGQSVLHKDLGIFFPDGQMAPITDRLTILRGSLHLRGGDSFRLGREGHKVDTVIDQGLRANVASGHVGFEQGAGGRRIRRSGRGIGSWSLGLFALVLSAVRLTSFTAPINIAAARDGRLFADQENLLRLPTDTTASLVSSIVSRTYRLPGNQTMEGKFVLLEPSR